MNIKIFFKKPEGEPNVTFNHYGVTGIDRFGSMVIIHKGEQDVIVNWDNVNQIIEL